MNKEQNKIYRFNYFFAIATALLLILINQIYIQYSLQERETDFKVMNIAGKQRMLSQRICLLLLKGKENNSVIDELNLQFENWENTHNNLKYGNDLLSIPAIDNEEIKNKLYALDKYVFFIKGELNYNNYIDSIGLISVFDNQTKYLKAMDEIVTLLQKELEYSVNKIRLIEFILAIFSVLVVILQFNYIVKPATKKIIKQAIHLKNQNFNLNDFKNKLKSILDSTTDIFILIDLNYKILLYNLTAETELNKIFHKIIKSNEDFIELIFPNNKEEIELDIKKAILNKSYFIERGFVLDKTKVWFELRYFAVMGEQNELSGISFIATNITDRKLAEQKVKEQVKTLGEIAWFQSHELRKPVANILGIVSLFESDPLHPENEKLVTFLHKEAKNLDEIIKTISLKAEAK
jgi:PAS domain S-box-containing protein